MANLELIASRMADRLAGKSKQMMKTIAPMVPTKARYPLTPRQQLTRFLNHTPQSLDTLRARVGDKKYTEYLQAMKGLHDQHGGQ